MQKEDITRIEEQQQRFFGAPYRGASLSKVSFDSGDSKRIAKWIAQPENFLVVTGPAGTGKTYLCAAILASLPKNIRTFRAISERDLFRNLRQGFGEGSHGDYLSKLGTLLDDELNIIDDLGSSGHTDWREEVLLEAIDLRIRSGFPTVITSNLGRQEVYETYGPRIGTRLFDKKNTIIYLDNSKNFRDDIPSFDYNPNNH